jgi:hypothetical protein
MRTDNYLNLCLDQAAKSPLHYRHGAIIVRGGKVIGQGYNDYRTGFDGGALKTGLLPLRSLDGPAIAELKKKKLKSRRHVIEEAVPAAAKTFTPFEMTTGGGKLANTPLSMHSEMMAIQSALSAASCAASSAVSFQKSCFKLSGDSKRKARLRREAVKLYVETVCKFAAEQHTGESSVQEWRFEQSAPKSGCAKSCLSRRGEERGVVSREQYEETSNEKREDESSPSSQHWQQWTTRSQALTACT